MGDIIGELVSHILGDIVMEGIRWLWERWWGKTIILGVVFLLIWLVMRLIP